MGDAAHAVVPFYGQGMNAVSSTEWRRQKKTEGYYTETNSSIRVL